MSKRRLIFFTVVLVVCFSGYVGCKFYEDRSKSPLVGKNTNERSEPIDRLFLQPVRSVSQLPREIAKRFPSLTPPVWAYTPEKWNSGAIDSVKVIVLATEVVGFHVTEMPDRQTYRLPLPKEKTLLEGDVISTQAAIYRIFSTPENTPDITPPSLDELPIPFDVPIPDKSPIPYPLIAKVLSSPDDASLTQLRDWIKSVGGAARAQSLIEAAGLSDSIRIEAVTIFRQ